MVAKCTRKRWSTIAVWGTGGGVVLIEFDNYRSNIMKTRILGQSFGDILGECENEKIGQYTLCKGAALQRSTCE